MADAKYQTSSFRFANKGIVARYASDALPKGAYMNLDNMESRQENAIASRFGLFPLSTDGTTNLPLSGSVNTIGRMRGLSQSYRYAGANGQVYRIAGDGPGPFQSVASGLSGNKFSMSPYRPSGTSKPYNFIADANVLLKDDGTFAALQNWGIAPPVMPASLQIGNPDIIEIENFTFSFATPPTFANYTGTTFNYQVSGTITGAPGFPATGLKKVIELLPPVPVGGMTRSGGVVTVTATNNYKPGVRISVYNPTDTSFNTSSTPVIAASGTGFTYASPGPNATSGGLQTLISLTPSLIPGQYISVDVLPGAVPGPNFENVLLLSVFPPDNATRSPGGFTAYFNNPHSNESIQDQYVNGAIAANTVATVTRIAPLDLGNFSSKPTDPDDMISMFLNVADPSAIEEIRLIFDVGDGSFTKDYYYKSITPATFQPAVSGNVTTGQSQTDRVFARAGGLVDVRQVGVDDPSLLPTDAPDLIQLQPFELNVGPSVWTNVQVRLGEFVEVGSAGGASNNWSNVTGWQIQIKTSPNIGTSVGINDFLLIGGSGLDSFAGQPYDYRYTYYNINTGCESSPSITQLSQYFLSVRRQPIAVTMAISPDTQVTHYRVYRRGGTLTQAWYMVEQVDITDGATYTDTAADSDIEDNQILQIDADPPVTSLLQKPLDGKISIISAPLAGFPQSVGVAFSDPSMQFYTGQLITVGTPENSEQVYVQSIFGPGDPGNFIAFLQNDHDIGDPVTATTQPQVPMDLLAIAFDQAFLAGDPNNPHVLYYSRVFQPETFPPENFIEVGTPDSPIMGLVVLRGQLFVFTTKTVFQIYGGGGATPIPIPTGVMHGLVAKFAWCASENIIYYASYDGIYAFQGSSSAYISEPTEWIWTGQNLGPIQAIEPGQTNTIFMAYCNHEVYVSYRDQNGVRHRLIYSEVYSRWRNDDQAFTPFNDITAMFFEQDTGDYVVGKTDGMVYLDRVNDYDSGGYRAGLEIKNPILINMQTAQDDLGVPKAFKVFNELTLDFDTQGQPLLLTLLFDNGDTQIPLGNVSQNGRNQLQININNGKGQRSQNMGLLITGGVTKVVEFYEGSIRALVEAEFRKSWDTYLLDFDTASYKIIKQGQFVYVSSAGVSIDMFVEDSVIPRFSFALPPSSVRKATIVRFPATKFKIIRFVGTSTADFQLYPDSFFEWKPVGGPKGYAQKSIMQ